MNDRATRQPMLTPDTAADKKARADRLAAEMRKNLVKRKRQQREKVEGEAIDSDEQGARKDLD